MLNFLFEGTIGELLAPVSSPFHQLQLAIQRHEHDKVYELITSGGIDPGGLGDKTGLAPIHYAAKHNNRQALELVLARGVSVNQTDRSGNTALHHAAAGGHFELVQFLISQGAAPAARNQAGKTPYDVSSSILVSQFLMPLQLAAEQDDGTSYVAPITPVATQGYSAGFAGSYASGYSSFTQSAQPAIEHADVPGIAVDPTPLVPLVPTTHFPPSSSGVMPSSSTATFVPAYSGGYTSSWAGSGMGPTPAPTSPSATTSAGSLPAVSIPAVVPRSSTVPAPAGGRIIRPDGFHSSATDPALQEKYGHTKQVKVTAPPPTGGPSAPTSYNLFGQQAPQAPLYVPYDFQPHTRVSPTPPGAAHYTTPSPPVLVGASASLSTSPPPTAASLSPPTASPGGRSSSTGQGSTPLVHLNVFNPAADNVVSASSSSSAVL